MTRLSVNVNKIALLRNSRNEGYPDLELLTKKIVSYGADGITVHPRADKRHITPDDARMVAREVTTCEVNFEGDLREEFLDLVFECKPAQCTLVPVAPGEITSHHGWNLKKWGFLVGPVIQKLKSVGVRVSLFLEANPEDVYLASALGAQRIEIYTAPFAAAHRTRSGLDAELKRLALTAEAARKCGVGLNAGHDLTVENLPVLLKTVPDILEVSIGHFLIGHALEVGLERSVHNFLAITRQNAAHVEKIT